MPPGKMPPEKCPPGKMPPGKLCPGKKPPGKLPLEKLPPGNETFRKISSPENCPLSPKEKKKKKKKIEMIRKLIKTKSLHTPRKNAS